MGLIPRETLFFDELEALSTVVVAGARILQEALEGPATLDEGISRLKQARALFV